MRIACKQCGKFFSTHYRRGIFEFCSMDCFIEYLKNPYNMNGFPLIKNSKSYFKSGWEEAFFNFMKTKNLNLKYEPYILKFGRLIYIPDFFINGHFIEVKGLWQRNSWKKVRVFREFLDITVLDGLTLKIGGII